MHRNKSSRKLSLDKTTIRNLSTSLLDSVAGGVKVGSEACASGRPGCSAKCDSEAHLTCSQSNWASICTQ